MEAVKINRKGESTGGQSGKGQVRAVITEGRQRGS